ncbi:hypothetical protein N7471_009215 [Penicillium samsonianum]|uniref:uncharacterized protein n=1 Tax=Penicillium samsonianum TaxID=1882272 RepID=UPI002548B8F2|nr:uncharacterized protein N7471_009215 [Penicillium samsonianum]KAJ6127998.1 hypothetical protein N7471_009215 [Penicillium samsonianum]
MDSAFKVVRYHRYQVNDQDYLVVNAAHTGPADPRKLLRAVAESLRAVIRDFVTSVTARRRV